MSPEAKGKRYFGEIAIEKGLANEAQVDECLAIQKTLRSRGEEKTLGAIMHDKGYLSLVQVNEIMAEVEGSRRRQSLEGYEIISKLGEGGMGTVYLARQVSLNKLVAIKVLPPKLARNKDYLKRFRREAQATAKLNHPHIVQAIDVGESNGYYYFVMEYVEGETVKEMLGRQGILEEDRVIEIATQIGEALEHASKHDIVHRDIKPANLMITQDGQAKLCDLGLAFDLKEDGSITQSGIIMGTPYYLSPEQARTEELDIRSDLYSFGATLFHMATGTVPYEGETAAVILTKHLAEPIPDPMERNPILSKGFCYVLERCMQKDPEARYQDADEFLEDLRGLGDPRVRRGEATPGGEGESSSGGTLWRRLGLVGGAAALSVAVPLAVVQVPDLWGGTDRSDDPADPEARRMSREEAAQEALAEADRSMDAAPEALEEARDRYLAIEDEYEGTPAASAARDQVARIESLLTNEARSAYLSLEADLQPLRQEGRWAEALERIDDYLTAYRHPLQANRARQLREQVRREAARAFESARARATEYANAGDYAGAAGLVQPFLDVGVPDIEEQAARALGEIEEAARLAPARPDLPDAEEDRALLARGVRTILDRLAGSGFERAAEQARLLLADPAYATVRPWLRTVSRDLDEMRELASSAEERLRRRVGEEVTLAVGNLRRTGELVGVEGGLLRLEVGPGILTVPLARLDARDILEAAGVGADGPRGELFAGIIGLARAETGGAVEDHLTAAGEDGGREVAPYLLVSRQVEGE